SGAKGESRGKKTNFEGGTGEKKQDQAKGATTAASKTEGEGDVATKPARKKALAKPPTKRDEHAAPAPDPAEKKTRAKGGPRKKENGAGGKGGRPARAPEKPANRGGGGAGKKHAAGYGEPGPAANTAKGTRSVKAGAPESARRIGPTKATPASAQHSK